MSFTDFLDNITNPGWVSMQLDELLDITREFGQDMIDVCQDEGAAVVEAAPAAIKELSDILAPLQGPTLANILTAGVALKQAFDDDTVESETRPAPILLLPPP